jgi:hypothetical protein
VLLDLGCDFAEKRTLRFFVGEPHQQNPTARP